MELIHRFSAFLFGDLEELSNMVEKENIKSQTKKCSPCFRKAECMLYVGSHAGIELCLGPFTDEEDRLKKVKEDFDKYKKKADLDRAIREVMKNEYVRNKKLFDD